MYRVPLTLHKALRDGKTPIIYCTIDTGMGKRVYASKELTCTISSALEKSARVLSFGSFERTILPITANVLTAYEGKQQQHCSIQLDNTDRYFSRLIAKEPFLGCTLTIYMGLESDSTTSHVGIFQGVISEISLMPTMSVEADER